MQRPLPNEAACIGKGRQTYMLVSMAEWDYYHAGSDNDIG